MRAWQFDSFGDVREVLKLREVAIGKPGAQECVVRTRALALNFPDLLLVEGKYQLKPELPASPGMEAMGIVEAAGEGSKFKVGQRVLVSQIFGSFAEAIVVPDALMMAVPDDMSDAEAAAFHVTYQTSYFGLVHRAAVKPGETVLVHGAAGGVGTAAVQIAKALGARVIATAGGAAKCEIARKCGADLTIDTRTQDFVAVVKGATEGRGADVIYDPIGGETFDKSTKVVAFEGRILVIGFASGTIPTLQVNRMLLKTASVVGLQWGAYKMFAPEKVEAAHQELLRMFASGKIKPVVYEKTFALEQLLDALDALRSREAYGKVVVTVK
ncbi:MAG: NADPH:quinone oxidoreductase family protein [Archangium sp.]